MRCGDNGQIEYYINNKLNGKHKNFYHNYCNHNNNCDGYYIDGKKIEK